MNGTSVFVVDLSLPYYNWSSDYCQLYGAEKITKKVINWWREWKGFTSHFIWRLRELQFCSIVAWREDMEKSNNITAEEYLEMRQSVGWSVFPLEQAAEGLKNTAYICCIREYKVPIAMGKRSVWLFLLQKLRGISAVGSAPHWQCKISFRYLWSHGFKSRMLQDVVKWER